MHIFYIRYFTAKHEFFYYYYAILSTGSGFFGSVYTYVCIYICVIRVKKCHIRSCVGADVNATTRCGRTALYIASACDRGDIINILLENGR